MVYSDQISTAYLASSRRMIGEARAGSGLCLGDSLSFWHDPTFFKVLYIGPGGEVGA
jgi:hypothetical protein